MGRRMKGADTFIARRSAPGSTGSLPRRGFRRRPGTALGTAGPVVRREDCARKRGAGLAGALANRSRRAGVCTAGWPAGWLPPGCCRWPPPRWPWPAWLFCRCWRRDTGAWAFGSGSGSGSATLTCVPSASRAKPVVTTRLTALQPRRHDGLRIVLLRHGHRAHGHGFVRLHDIDERALGPALHGGGRHHDDVAQRIDAAGAHWRTRPATAPCRGWGIPPSAAPCRSSGPPGCR